MKKIQIPIVNNNILARFPRICVCCEKPVEKLFILHFSKKVVLSSIWIGDEEKELVTNTYVSDFKIPYCLKHFKESFLIERAKKLTFLLLSLLFALLTLYFFSITNFLTGIGEWIGAILISIISGIFVGSAGISLMSSILFIIIKHYPFAPLFENAALGLKIKLSHNRKSLIFIFTNENIARAFAILNNVSK